NRATKSQQKRARTLNTDSDLDILDEMLLSYDRRALPGSREKNPTVVFCELFIRSFGSINPESMVLISLILQIIYLFALIIIISNKDYEVDLYLRQSWVDKRLQTPNLSRPLDLNDPNLVKKIWKPEVFFVNAKEAEFQFVTVPNVLIRLEPSGNILYMLRLKLRFSCMMDLYRYPMDTQVCAIELASCK
ncbi:glycine receptor subunit alpha-2-like protein, partial [Dinothrombium tinctorium]